MKHTNFEVTAVWDDEARIWYARSDIIGLHIEAETLEEFQALVREHAASLIVENHYSKDQISASDLKDLIPTVFVATEGTPKAS